MLGKGTLNGPECFRSLHVNVLNNFTHHAYTAFDSTFLAPTLSLLCERNVQSFRKIAYTIDPSFSDVEQESNDNGIRLSVK